MTDAAADMLAGVGTWERAASGIGWRGVPMRVTASRRQHDVDPWAYMRDALVRVSIEPNGRLRELRPDRWQAAPDLTVSPTTDS